MQLIDNLKALATANLSGTDSVLRASRDADTLDRQEASQLASEIATALQEGNFERLTIQNPGLQTRITYVNQKQQMSTLEFTRH